MEEANVLNGSLTLKDYGSNYNGKHNGWAYQFLNNNYEGINLGVCCKDFLQDIVWSELTGKEMNIYGQNSKSTNTFKDQENLILCVYSYSIDLSNMSEEKLLEYSLNLQGFLNEIETLKNYSLSTVDLIDKKFIIHFSKEWIKLPLIFSAFTLLCRIGFYYDGNLENYINTLYDKFRYLIDNCDKYNINNNYNTLLIFIYDQCNINQLSWEELKTPSEVHNSGFFNNLTKITYAHNKNKEKSNNTISY